MLHYKCRPLLLQEMAPIADSPGYALTAHAPERYGIDPKVSRTFLKGSEVQTHQKLQRFLRRKIYDLCIAGVILRLARRRAGWDVRLLIRLAKAI